jgi:hypothetical protein
VSLKDRNMRRRSREGVEVLGEVRWRLLRCDPGSLNLYLGLGALPLPAKLKPGRPGSETM